MKRTIIITVGAVLILVLVLFMVVNFAFFRILSSTGGLSEQPAAEMMMTNAAHAMERTGEKVSRCIPASDTQLNSIQAGLKRVNNETSIKTAWAVKSKDQAELWMVSAMIYGPEMEDGVGPGLWGMEGDPEEEGKVYAVDGFALKYSDWPDGSKGDVKLSTLFTDGAQEVMKCADPFFP